VKLAACTGLGLTPENRVWYRAFDPKHMHSPLGTAHTVSVPSRFSPGPLSPNPFQILYLAANQLICLKEVRALFGSTNAPVPNPTNAWTIINVQVVLQGVADLTLVKEQRRLGTTAQELTGDWEGYQTRGPGTPVSKPTGTAPTQNLGEALFATRDLEAFRVLSAKVPDQMNLVVFPGKLRKGSRISFQDHTGTTHEIKG
jgi:RES domain-containing protein